jgi:subtilisin-like proprotein convertase family protein
MKLFSTKLLCFLIAAFGFSTANAQTFFTDIAESAVNKVDQKRVIIPEKYRTLRLDTASMLPFLRNLPWEKDVITNINNTPVVSLPMPDGSLARFHVWQSPIMEKELPAGYPELKTFTGQGIDDRTATIKLDWTEFGFHAMILSPVTGAILIDPYDQRTITNYISYYKADQKIHNKFQELPPIENLNGIIANNPHEILAGPCVGTQLRTYRLAIACTGEYAVAATGFANPTRAQILAKVVTSVTRLDGIYETEAAIRLVLIANDTVILFPSAASDPFNGNANSNLLIDESQTQIDNRIGNANYDIGHTFSTQTAGLAALGVVCIQGNKASGVTGIANPVGDAYDVDYVAHEMGHQFGADHTFNYNPCGSTASDQNAEPGSGVTIMAYAGLCGSENLALHSIPYFHPVSFDKISTNVNSGNASSCDVATATGNSIPVVNAGADYTIPSSTPFILTGSATDANGDALTYDWEQVDVGGPNGASTSPSGNAPLFRSFIPQTTGVRYFPKLSDVTSNMPTIGERLPIYARSMKFRLTARDNRAGGGGVCFDETTITVVSDSFKVTYPTATGITWYVNDFQTVTWNPMGTAAAPVGCSNVTIQLSTDGGLTYPVTLSASTPNDGSEEIQVPANLTTTARIRVLAVGNVFYDISNSNFRILNSPTATFAFNTPASVAVCGNSGAGSLKSGSLGSFTTPINLSAANNPVGTTVSFGTNPLTPGGTTTVTLNNTGGLGAGTYTITITGIAGAVTKTKDINFVVTPNPSAPSSLTAPAADATGVAVVPAFNWSIAASASSYTLEISTVSDFSSIVQTLSGITALPYAPVNALTENTVYYWRVKSVNGCGTGAASVTGRFKTGILSCFTSGDVPKDISSVGTPTVTSTITIPAASGITITDLNVTGLIGTHNYVNDLTISLKGPNNVTRTLMSGVCEPFGQVQDFNINFDDQAATATIPCPPTDGSIVIPAQTLSVFNGLNSAGTWTLIITDNVNEDGGALTGWGLNINGTSATGCSYAATPLAITYTFTGNGNWNVAGNWSNNIIPPNPLPSGSAIVINHAVAGVCTLNVSQTISAGATLTIMTGKNLVVPGTLTVQ